MSFRTLLIESCASKIGLLVLLGPLAASAQFENNANKLYEAEGKMVTFRLVPGDKSAKLFIVGKKTAEFDFKRDAKLLRVFVPGQKGDLAFSSGDDSYEIQGLPSSPNTVLDIRAEIKGRPERVKVRLQKP